MKKVLFLIPLFLFSLMANAAIINITPTSPKSADNLRRALETAESGDIIEMAAGTYVESNSNWIAFTGKNVIVRAASGANVIIQPQVSVRLKGGSRAEFIGVKFDCSRLQELSSDYTHVMFPADASDNNKLILRECEFYGFGVNSSIITSDASNKLDSLVINNCYFHDNTKSCVFLQNTNAVVVKVTNSTFANIATAASYYAGVIDMRSTTGSLTVDHCTFYNVQVMGTDYAAIGKVNAPGAVVSNCIFAMPESTDNLRAIRDVAQAKNCLTYNYLYDSGKGIHSSVTKTNCIFKKSPVFRDAANGDFTLCYASPARGKGTESSTIGDPRWVTATAPIAIPATLMPQDAELFSDSAGVKEGSPRVIDFKLDGSHKFNDADWAKWRIDVEHDGYYTFTLNANSTNSHSYLLSILRPNESVVESYPLAGSYAVPLTITTDMLWLTEGEYRVKIVNTTSWSTGDVVSVVVKYEGGATTALPGQIVGEDALLKKTDGGSKYMVRLSNGDLKSNDNENPTSEYAEWNVSASDACELAVTLNLDPVTSSGHNYRVELYNGNTLVDYSQELASDGLDDAVHTKGDIDLEKTLSIPSAGDYTIKLINRTQYSSMIIKGITFAPYVAPAGVTMTDTDTDNSAWVAEMNNTVDVQLNRTILGGMYNTICLPFKVSSTQCKAIFGNDVELYTLGSATISGDILNLQFNTASDIWNGTPILIKTSSDIVNPVFEGVTIESETGDHTDGGAVVFRSTFVQKEFHNGDQVLLLVANNMLAYPLSDRTLKGFRAYFEVKDTPSGAPIRSARIIAGEQVVTDIDLVEMQEDGMGKMIENGQVIIIRNGVRYNALGVEIK